MAHKPHTKLWEWQQKAKYGGTCTRCRKSYSRLTVDHVIPANIVEMLDAERTLLYEDERNFQLVCTLCNTFKANKLDHAHPMTKVLLLELVNKL